MSERVIGIDLGTSNSVVAVVEGDRAVVIPDREGRRTGDLGGERGGQEDPGELAQLRAQQPQTGFGPAQVRRSEPVWHADAAQQDEPEELPGDEQQRAADRWPAPCRCIILNARPSSRSILPCADAPSAPPCLPASAASSSAFVSSSVSSWSFSTDSFG